MDLRGQGTTEYLIILAVIIVIALVVVGVMGWFPGLGTGITEQQSKAYWQSASPIAISDWKLTSTEATDATFTVQNMTTDLINVREITVDGTAIDATDTNVSAGATANITGSVGKACAASGVVYQYSVVITYDVIGGIGGKTQTGAKPIVGTCP